MPNLIIALFFSTLSITHKYNIGDNLYITSDSICAQHNEPIIAIDSLPTSTLLYGQSIVVAGFQIVPSDTIDTHWVQVGTYAAPCAIDSTGQSPQAELVWVRHSDLIIKTIPDQFLTRVWHALYLRAHLWKLLSIGILVFLLLSRYLQHSATAIVYSPKAAIILIDHIPSIYPSLLLALIATATSLANIMATGTPSLIHQYFYSPTLNPFATSGTMAVVISLVWLSVIVFIALVIDLANMAKSEHAWYFLSIPGICTCVAIFFSWPLLADNILLLYIFLCLFNIWMLADIVRTIRH